MKAMNFPVAEVLVVREFGEPVFPSLVPVDAVANGHLKARGIAFESEADEATTGPASLVVVDPDGNPILFDQHV